MRLDVLGNELSKNWGFRARGPRSRGLRLEGVGTTYTYSKYTQLHYKCQARVGRNPAAGGDWLGDAGIGRDRDEPEALVAAGAERRPKWTSISASSVRSRPNFIISRINSLSFPAVVAWRTTSVANSSARDCCDASLRQPPVNEKGSVRTTNSC